MATRARVLVPVADGSEELELVSVVDLLRRGNVDVVVASVMPHLGVRCSRGVKLEADVLLDDVASDALFDAVVLPGGMPGAAHLRDSAALLALLVRHDAAGRLLAAICAAPAVVLHTHGLIRDRCATAFPSHCPALPNQSAVNEAVVEDGNLITSRGVGTAHAFALAVLRRLCGVEVAEETRMRALINL